MHPSVIVNRLAFDTSCKFFILNLTTKNMGKFNVQIPVLRPESTVRMFWDLAVGLVSLYSLIYVPVFTFFDQQEV